MLELLDMIDVVAAMSLHMIFPRLIPFRHRDSRLLLLLLRGVIGQSIPFHGRAALSLRSDLIHYFHAIRTNEAAPFLARLCRNERRRDKMNSPCRGHDDDDMKPLRGGGADGRGLE